MNKFKIHFYLECQTFFDSSFFFLDDGGGYYDHVHHESVSFAKLDLEVLILQFS